MQNSSSLEASSNVATSSRTVSLAVDDETLGKLSAAATRTDDAACAMTMRSGD